MLYSLRSRLMAAFCILLVIPFTILVYVMSEQIAKEIKRSTEVATSQTIDQYASHVTTLLTQVEDICNQVLGSELTQDWIATLRNTDATQGDRLYAGRKLRDFLSTLAVNNSNGISVTAFTAREGGIWTQDRSYTDQLWYKQYRDSNNRWTSAHLEPDQLDEKMKETVVNSYILPLMQLQSFANAGIIKVNYPTSLLLKPIEKIQFGQTGRAYLLNRDGSSVLGQDITKDTAVLREGMKRIRTNAEDSEAGFIQVNHGGTGYLVFYRTLPEQDWTIAAIVPEAELYVKIKQIRNMLLMISGVLLIVVLIVAFRLSKGITRPLSSMARAMKYVRQGDFHQALERMPVVKAGHSELGTVTQAFEQMTHRLKYLIETEFELNLRRKNAEYKALLLQINPHFFNNSLEIISGMAAQKREDLVMDATEALGKMMRYSLNLNTDVVQLHDEFAYIRDYLFILKLRYGDDLNAVIEEETEAGQLAIPKFILQPLVENAVKYSLEKGKGSVRVQSQVEADRLHLIVSDNGIGMSPDFVKELLYDMAESEPSAILSSKGDSIGLRNVLSRCRLSYGDLFEARFESEIGIGTTITLILPKREGAV